MSARKRHIAYVLKRFPRISETFIAAELIELRRQGERVTVFALDRPDEPFEHGFLGDLDVPVVYLPRRPLRQPLRTLAGIATAIRLDPRRWLRACRWLWPPRLRGVRRLAQASVLRREMHQAGIDHAHAHFATAAARVAGLAHRMGGPTYSVTTHAKDIYHEEVEPEHLVEKLGEATFVATVTEANRGHLASVLGDGANVHVVRNSVDLHRFHGLQRDPQPGLVLSVARLVEKKGLADLVEACRLLRNRDGGIPAARLEIVGDGPLREDLEQQAAGGVPIAFRGSLPQERVMESYARAAVFCLPCVVASTGDRDGLPTSVLEAMAAGVPVVTTAVNGLSEVVLHEQTGLLVPEHDPEALAGAIARLLADPELAHRLAREARQLVARNHALAQSAEQLRSLLPASP